ncbi:MAG: hypothetical protein NVS4B3_01770 [Gemmatimonadaceae bacterium]
MITHVFFDIGGVLGSNAWDHDQRQRAVTKFGLDERTFADRHQASIGALEEGRMSLDEYLDTTVFDRPRSFTPGVFRAFMREQSVPLPESIVVVRTLRARDAVRLFTLNNESAELNAFRIGHFGLRNLFDAFLTSCYLGARKPSPVIYERALGIAQADPATSVFVDDRPENLAPAAAMGMRTILFRNAAQLSAELRALGLID